MKIAINCIYFIPKGGGIKEYIYNLVKNISEQDKENEYVFYVYKDGLDYWHDNFGYNLNVKTIPYKRKDRIRNAVFGNVFWYYEVKKEKFDLFHSPFFHTPLFIKTKKIVTVHDLRFVDLPKTYGKIRYVFLKYSVPFSIKRADKIISISQYTKDVMKRAFNIEDSKIDVIHESIDFDRFKKDKVTKSRQNEVLLMKGLKENGYILTVGHVEPRKNYDRLIKVFLKLKSKDLIKEKLVIIGQKHDATEYFKNKVENESEIIYLDFVDEDVLMSLYQNTKLFIFPSYYEGFGFPPLEAAAFDKPSIVSNVTSIPEICGDGALYFDPFDEDDMFNKLNSIIHNKELYVDTVFLSINNLKRFSWKKNALNTIELYNKTVHS